LRVARRRQERDATRKGTGYSGSSREIGSAVDNLGES